jgi:hypothetical protein
MARQIDPEQQLASFLAKYSNEVANLAEAVRGKMRKLYPTALELVYDNYNALAIGYCPSEKTSEAIFSIALYPKWVSFFFLQARGLSDPDRLLKGSGTVCKHVVMNSPNDLNEPAFRDLMHQALEIAKVPFPPKGEHLLIIKSVSANQRPRRPTAESATSAKRAKPATSAKRATSAINAKRATSANAAKAQ